MSDTVKIKTAELTSLSLRYAVAKCLELPVYFDGESLCTHSQQGIDPPCPHFESDWSTGGLIIEREGITPEAKKVGGGEYVWMAYTPAKGSLAYGDTPLVAVMRCYVASKFGDELEIPAAFAPATPQRMKP